MSGHGRKMLLVLPGGGNDIRKVHSEDLKNSSRMLGKRLKENGCDVMFSVILPRMGNGTNFISRAIDVNLWLEEFCRQQGFW